MSERRWWNEESMPLRTGLSIATTFVTRNRDELGDVSACAQSAAAALANVAASTTGRALWRDESADDLTEHVAR